MIIVMSWFVIVVFKELRLVGGGDSQSVNWKVISFREIESDGIMTEERRLM